MMRIESEEDEDKADKKTKFPFPHVVSLSDDLDLRWAMHVALMGRRL
jgi:hypothetical protein